VVIGPATIVQATAGQPVTDPAEPPLRGVRQPGVVRTQHRRPWLRPPRPGHPGARTARGVPPTTGRPALRATGRRPAGHPRIARPRHRPRCRRRGQRWRAGPRHWSKNGLRSVRAGYFDGHGAPIAMSDTRLRSVSSPPWNPTPQGLPVFPAAISISRATHAGSARAPPISPKPPPFDTAAASAPPDAPPMGASAMGCCNEKSPVNAVRNAMSSSSPGPAPRRPGEHRSSPSRARGSSAAGGTGGRGRRGSCSRRLPAHRPGTPGVRRARATGWPGHRRDRTGCGCA